MKVEALGSKASQPICIDSDDDSSTVNFDPRVQKTEASASPPIKKEPTTRPIKREPGLPTPTSSAKPSSLPRRSSSVSITDEKPCVSRKPVVISDSDPEDLFVDEEYDDDATA